MRHMFSRCPKCGYALRAELNDNEKKVLECIVKHGMCSKDIAARLGLALTTVKFYTKTLFDLYEVKTRLELVVKYHQKGCDS